MENHDNRKTSQQHWDSVWRLPVRARLPSLLNVDVKAICHLLRRHVRRGDRYIEIGCAPGKYLAWVASVLNANAVGLDYSEVGIKNTRSLFDALAIPVELFQGDFFNHNLPLSSFNVVVSLGFIEHFDDPTDAILRHVELLAPGGVAIIEVPNYGGIYGTLQKKFDPENLAIHNTACMHPDALLQLASGIPGIDAKSYYVGSISLWLVNLEKRWGKRNSIVLKLIANAIGQLQFFTWAKVAPMVVLEIRKR